jgi:2-C-methyl-D-erythritol 4-phosphate cytidylyltransferase
MELWSVVVAGGTGARYGGLKQLEPLAGRRVLDWAVDAVGSHRAVEGTVLVVPASEVDRPDLPPAVIVAGGATRSASVRCGLRALPDTATHVLIHDGARPLASKALVDRVVGQLGSNDAVVPVIPVTDTLRTVGGGPADRHDFVAVQTPQGFALDALRRAHEADPDATDDASLVDAAGGSVVHVAGDPANVKITTPADLVVAQALLAEVMA